MGSIIKGTCKNCGYETREVFYGGGMINIRESCKFPVSDRFEKEIRTADITAKEEVVRQNPNLVFYDDTSLSDLKLQNKENYEEWGEYKLHDRGYLFLKGL